MNQDVKHFHKSLKTACDQHYKSYYGEFKKWCDDYFVIPHRGERRGVGGIFFDDLDFTGTNKEFDFVKSCANSILPCYVPIIKKNMDKGYGHKERYGFIGVRQSWIKIIPWTSCELYEINAGFDN